MSRRALGLIETFGFVGVTEAADAAVKAAAVELGAIERIEGGLVSIRLLGDVGAVQAAVQAGAQAAQQVGQVVAQHVIPNPHDDLVSVFNLDSSNNRPENGRNLDDLPVAQLRQLARETPGLAIQGRQISHANRDELLNELKRVQD